MAPSLLPPQVNEAHPPRAADLAELHSLQKTRKERGEGWAQAAGRRRRRALVPRRPSRRHQGSCTILVVFWQPPFPASDARTCIPTEFTAVLRHLCLCPTVGALHVPSLPCTTPPPESPASLCRNPPQRPMPPRPRCRPPSSLPPARPAPAWWCASPSICTCRRARGRAPPPRPSRCAQPALHRGQLGWVAGAYMGAAHGFCTWELPPPWIPGAF